MKEINLINIKLSIVTVNYGNTSPLTNTLESIDEQSLIPYEHIIVASGISSHHAKDLVEKYTNSYRRFVINQDKSLYNAMNIGLYEATGNCVFFLNSGDKFLSNGSIALIHDYWQYGKCLIFRTAQCFGSDCYVRPGLKNINDLLVIPGHQGFIAPLEHNYSERLLFNEEKIISADSLWMKQYIAKYESVIVEDLLTKFSLGGISNNPTLKSVKLRYCSGDVLSAIKEVIKLIARLFLGYKLYYALMAKLRNYDRLSTVSSSVFIDLNIGKK